MNLVGSKYKEIRYENHHDFDQNKEFTEDESIVKHLCGILPQ